MKNESIKKEIERLLDVLVSGTQADIKEAKKELEKINRKNRNEFTKSSSIAFEYMDKFDDIKSAKNQAALASGLSTFFLVLADENFNTIKDFVVKSIQHPNGQVRESIRKSADWLYMSLSSRISPYIYPAGKKMSEKQKKDQLEAQKQYAEYVQEVEDLIDEYEDESHDEIEEVEQLKPSVYKTLQMLWSDLTRIEHRFDFMMAAPSQEIVDKRKDIKKNFLDILKNHNKYHRDMIFDDIVAMIYNETGNKSLQEIFMIFNEEKDFAKIKEIVQVVNDAWNYFPHRCLDGKCPIQMINDSNISNM